jgi:hypothetical protein
LARKLGGKNIRREIAEHQVEITENYGGPNAGVLPAMVTEARHVNDGICSTNSTPSVATGLGRTKSAKSGEC